jgi:threonine aldolase
MHFPRTQVICVENSQNVCGGVPVTPQYTASVVALGRRYGVPVHVDGARIFNSAVALGVDVKELTRGADSLQFCLSKGLGCPVGSMVCGSKDFIHEAVRNRKMLGGQMRQAGIIAAAGIVAMEQSIGRLAEDHANAKILGQGLREIKGLKLRPEVIQTNILYFQLTDNRMTHDELIAKSADEGVQVLRMGDWIRAVTHYGIVEDDVKSAAAVIKRVVEAA